MFSCDAAELVGRSRMTGCAGAHRPGALRTYQRRRMRLLVV